MSGPGGAPTQGRRLATRLGPEFVGGLLSVVVLVAAGSFILAAATGPGSPAPSAAATPFVSSSPATSTAPGASVSPDASAAPTVTPWAGQAVSMIATGDRLIDLRERLAAELSGGAARAREIARLLRTANPTMTNALSIIDRLEAAGVTASLIAALRSAVDDALESSLEALDAAIDNSQAYETGATRIIEALDGIETQLARLRSEANLPSPSDEP